MNLVRILYTNKPPDKKNKKHVEYYLKMYYLCSINHNPMNENDILKIVEDAFDDQITADGWLDDGTPMGTIVGKQFFMKQVADKLKKLFDENDLSK